MIIDKIKNHKFVKSTALWIKEYTHPLNVLGGIFFVLALIAGVIWVAGKEIEPIAFLLGMLSSLFLAAPSVAAFIIPERKAVRHMSYQEILDFIVNTDSRNDWRGVSTNMASEYFLKEDPRLRFRSKHTDDGIQNSDFKETWANCYPDPRAAGYWYDLFYDGAFISRFILVSVDGARATLPTPDWSTGKVSRLHYKVADIFDCIGNLDEYMRRSKLELE